MARSTQLNLKKSRRDKREEIPKELNVKKSRRDKREEIPKG